MKEIIIMITIIVLIVVFYIVHRVIQTKKDLKEFQDSQPKGVIRQCGWCYKFNINGKWTYAVLDAGVVSHGCCPDCLKTLNDALEEMERKNARR